MKEAKKVIRSEGLVPEIYPNESRDFALLTRLYDAVYNSCKWNSNGIRYVNDAKNINDNILLLLADKLGIENTDAELLTNDELRLILLCLPKMIKEKGSLLAINDLVSLYFKIYHLTGDFSVSLGEDGTTVMGNMVTDRTVIIALETMAKSTTLIEVLSKYILPPGYSFFIYFYNKNIKDSRWVYEDSATLLYHSNQLAYKIEMDIPNFIKEYNTFLLPTVDYGLKPISGHTTYNISPNTVQDSLGAIDTKYIAGFNIDLFEENFLGYFSQEQLDLIKTNYSNAQPYSDSTTYANLDVYYVQTGSIKEYFVNKIISSKVNPEETVVDKKKIQEGTLAVLDSDTISVVYFKADEKDWKLLNNIGGYTGIPEATLAWDVCCVVDEKETPMLCTKIDDVYTFITMEQREAVYNPEDIVIDPTGSRYFVYCPGDNKYYAKINQSDTTFTVCSEGTRVPTASELMLGKNIRENTLYWLRGGRYYISKPDANNEEFVWTDYTMPMYLIRINQISGGLRLDE